MSNLKSILLVHGGLVDGSGWESVYQILKKDGFEVLVVKNNMQASSRNGRRR